MTRPTFLIFCLILAVAAPPTAQVANGAGDETVFGNPDGDVTLTEFIDYQCPGCKAIHTRLMSHIERDGMIRLEVKEVAILGPGSLIAAKAALAARAQGRYRDLHGALLRVRGGMTRKRILDLAALLYLDLVDLRSEMNDPALEREIAENFRQARKHRIKGTPMFLVNDRLVEDPSIEGILAAVAAARSKP